MSSGDRRGEPQRAERRGHAVRRAIGAATGALAATAMIGLGGPALSSAGAAAFNASEVKDINVTPNGGHPEQITAAEHLAFFTAYEPSTGTELWKTDGTTAGTALVDDLNPGPGSSTISQITDAGGRVYFITFDSAGRSLWTSDGTAAGTIRIETMPAATNIGSLTSVGASLYFAQDGELMQFTPGEPAPVAVHAFPDGVESLTAVNGTLYLVADDGPPADNHPQLWSTDGTTTQPVPGAVAGSVFDDLTADGSTLYFTVGSGADAELWSTSEGTAAPVIDGANNPVIGNVFNLTAVGSTIFFSARDGAPDAHLWKATGSSATQVTTGAMPALTGTVDDDFTAYGSELAFVAGGQVWTSDGTAAGTQAATTINNLDAQTLTATPEVVGLPNAVPAELYFVSAGQLWKLGSALGGGGATEVPGPGPDGQIIEGPSASEQEAGNGILFAADDGVHGDQLWSVAGGLSSMVSDIDGGTAFSGPSSMVDFDGELYFSAFDGSAPPQLWRSDGTNPGTAKVTDAAAGVDGLAVAGSRLFFTGEGASSDIQLWSSDGTAAGTASLLPANTDADDSTPVAVGGQVFFVASQNGQSGLWKSDGTTAGTGEVASGAADLRTASGGALFYFDGDGQLLRTDGSTPVGLTTIPAGSEVEAMAPIDGTVAFLVDNNMTNALSLWGAGGQITAPAGLTASDDDELTSVGNRLYFLADGGTLWTTDGTANGTGPVTGAPRFATGLSNVNGTLFFDGSANAGPEVWEASGTNAARATSAFGAGAAPDGDFAAAGSAVMFSASTPALGDELWSTDSSPAGASPVADIHPGPADSNPGPFVAVGPTVFFPADDGSTGDELWKAVPAAPSTTTPPPASPPAGEPAPARAKLAKVQVSGRTASYKLTCTGTAGQQCAFTLTESVTEKFRGKKLISIASVTSASGRKPAKPKTRTKTIVVGRTRTTIAAGRTRTVKVTLNAAGRKLLATHRKLKTRFTLTLNGRKSTSRTVAFTQPKPKPEKQKTHKGKSHKPAPHKPVKRNH